MLQIIILTLISSAVFARDDGRSCLRLLNGSPHATDETATPDSVELAQAQLWMNDHGRGPVTDNEGTAIFNEWQRWSKTTQAQRNANLALELKRISKPDESNLVSLDGRAQLESLSKKNLQRMKVQIETRYPQTAVLLNDKILEAQSRSVSLLLRIAYSVDRAPRRDDGVNAPIVSPRQLQKHNLVPRRSSFYSSLVGQSPSAEFDVKMASSKTMLPSAIYLRTDIAEQQGFVIPQFDIAENLFAFFSIWDPEALDQVYAHNRNSFPSKVNSGQTMMAYFHEGPVSLDDVFPMTAPERLSVLREKLSDYVLTEKDAVEYLRHALQLYVLWLKHNNSGGHDRLTSGLYGTLAPGDFILRDFLSFAGLPGLSLRVPVASTAKDYTLVRDVPRSEQFRYGTSFATVDHLNPDGGRGRLDHNSKP